MQHNLGRGRQFGIDYATSLKYGISRSRICNNFRNLDKKTQSTNFKLGEKF